MPSWTFSVGALNGLQPGSQDAADAVDTRLTFGERLSDKVAAVELHHRLLAGAAGLAILDTALRVTRAEAGLGRDSFIDTDISAMVEIYGRVAKDRSFTVEAVAPSGPHAVVQRDLLGQA
jgi:hypothetical protein